MILYTDGGVIVKNPSVHGGTYAWVIVDEDRVIHRGSGVYDPNDMGTQTVTNNQMELLAVLLGLQAAQGRKIKIRQIRSDSQITLGRLFQGWSLKNIPDWMIDLKDNLSVHGIRGEFVKGHNGEKWNEMVDLMADDEAVRFLQRNGLTHLISAHKNPWYMRVRSNG
jgi:ribonuclease HI